MCMIPLTEESSPNVLGKPSLSKAGEEAQGEVKDLHWVKL